MECLKLVCLNCIFKDQKHYKHEIKYIELATQEMQAIIKPKFEEYLKSKENLEKTLLLINEEKIFLENEYQKLLEELKKKEDMTNDILNNIKNYENETDFNLNFC